MSEDENLFYLFEEMDQVEKVKGKDSFLRAPFGYPGGKSRSLKFILPLLPNRTIYVEPFGGSGSVLLAKPVSKLEVFNDRYAGVVAFYRCIVDSSKLDALVDRLDLTIDAREEWIWCASTWENCTDDVERAARWFYMHTYSFSNKGRCWGRQTGGSSMAGKVRERLKVFPKIHERMKNVQIENQDWRECIKDYANKKAVFYCDPPYLYDTSYSKIYDHDMRHEDHKHFLDLIFDTPGYFVISGYSSKLYESYKWDDRHEWVTYVSIGGNAYTEGNNKLHLKDKEVSQEATEVLWIKDNT
jgi:DNA adenine methylase